MKTYINRDCIISIKLFHEALESNIEYQPPKKHWWGTSKEYWIYHCCLGYQKIYDLQDYVNTFNGYYTIRGKELYSLPYVVIETSGKNIEKVFKTNEEAEDFCKDIKEKLIEI